MVRRACCSYTGPKFGAYQHWWLTKACNSSGSCALCWPLCVTALTCIDTKTNLHKNIFLNQYRQHLEFSFLITHFSSSGNLCIFNEFFWLQVAECQKAVGWWFKCKSTYLFLKKFRVIQWLAHITRGRVSSRLSMDSCSEQGVCFQSCHIPWQPLTQRSHNTGRGRVAKKGLPQVARPDVSRELFLETRTRFPEPMELTVHLQTAHRQL